MSAVLTQPSSAVPSGGGSGDAELRKAWEDVRAAVEWFHRCNAEVHRLRNQRADPDTKTLHGHPAYRKAMLRFNAALADEQLAEQRWVNRFRAASGCPEDAARNHIHHLTGRLAHPPEERSESAEQ